MAEANVSRRGFLGNMVGAGATLAIVPPAIALTADQRIQAAVDEIEDALREKFPGWRIQIKGGVQDVLDKGEFRPACQAILVYTSPEEFGPEEAGWHRTYL